MSKTSPAFDAFFCLGLRPSTALRAARVVVLKYRLVLPELVERPQDQTLLLVGDPESSVGFSSMARPGRAALVVRSLRTNIPGTLVFILPQSEPVFRNDESLSSNDMGWVSGEANI